MDPTYKYRTINSKKTERRCVLSFSVRKGASEDPATRSLLHENVQRFRGHAWLQGNTKPEATFEALQESFTTWLL
jgi:hypothetical protein